MAIERRNPLPIGIYWQDVFQPDLPAFLVWLDKAQKAGAVGVIRSQHFEANGGGPSRDWVLFRVTSPVAWEGPGFPTIADSASMTAEDSGQRPPPEQAPNLDDILPSPAKIGQSILLAGLFVGGVLLITRKR